MNQRVIKFRVWDNGRKEWIHGPGHEVNLFGEAIIVGGFLIREDDTHVGLDDLNDMIAVQFTGETYSDGAEVYEDDIYEYDYEYDSDYDGDMPIVKQSSGRGVVKHMTDTYAIRRAKEEGGKVRVIGNIHEHPNLL